MKAKKYQKQAVEALVDAMLNRRFPKAVAVDLPVIEMLRDEARAYLEALLPLMGVQRPKAMQIVCEEWHRAVREFGLTPGSQIETVIGWIHGRLAAIDCICSEF